MAREKKKKKRNTRYNICSPVGIDVVLFSFILKRNTHFNRQVQESFRMYLRVILWFVIPAAYKRYKPVWIIDITYTSELSALSVSRP